MEQTSQGRGSGRRGCKRKTGIQGRRGVGRGDARGRAGTHAAVRCAMGRGRLVAEPNSEENQVAHENQLQVQ